MLPIRIQAGDEVITCSHEFRYYLVGEIVSGFNWIAESHGDRDHIRKVRWIGKVNRDDLLRRLYAQTDNAKVILNLLC